MDRKKLLNLLYLPINLPAVLVTYIGYAKITEPTLKANEISRILKSVFEEVYDLSFSVKKYEPMDALNVIDEMRMILSSKQQFLFQHGYSAEPLYDEITKLSSDIQAFIPD